MMNIMYENTDKQRKGLRLKTFLSFILIAFGFTAIGWFLHSEKENVPLGVKQVPISEFTKLPPSKNTSGYVILATGEGLGNQATVKIRGIACSEENTHLWFQLQNAGSKKLQVLGAISNATLKDQDGKQYAAEPLKSKFTHSVEAEAVAEFELVFPPLPEKTRTTTLTLPGLFRLGEPEYTIVVPINLN